MPVKSLRLRGWLTRWLPPLCAFVVTKLFILGVATSGGVHLVDERLWQQGDQGHYLTIARDGYHLIECHKIGYVPDGWCGNAGWFPGYPALIRGLGALGVRTEVGGLVLAGLFQFLTLAILWIGFLGGHPSRRNILLLALAAFFPGQIFLQSIFPVSMFTCFALLCLLCIERQRFVLAGVAGAVAAYSYSTGFVLAPIAGLLVLLHHPAPSWLGTIRRLAATAGLTALGFGAVLLTHALMIGKWNAFFMVQAKYGHGVHEPLATLLGAIKGLLGAAPSFPAFQTLLIAGLVIGLVIAWPNTGEHQRARHVGLLVYGLAFWLFPLVMGSGVSLYRAEALLLPLVPAMARINMPLQLSLLAVFILLSGQMTLLFFANRLL